jgi:hypothetical protein
MYIACLASFNNIWSLIISGVRQTLVQVSRNATGVAGVTQDLAK